MTIVTNAPQSNPVIISLAALLGDAIVLTLARPDVIEALRQVYVAAPDAPTGLLSNAQLAAVLGVSKATIGRLELKPALFVGRSPRFNLDDAKQALAVRGKQPTKAKVRPVDADPIDVSAVGRRAGLRLAGGSK